MPTSAIELAGSDTPTFERFALDYLASVDPRVDAGQRKDSWGGDQRQKVLNTLIPAFGLLPIGALARRDVYDYIEARLTGTCPVRPGSRTQTVVSPKAVLNELTVLNQICFAAWEVEYLIANPCETARHWLKKKYPHVARTRVFLEELQLRALLRAAEREEAALFELMGRPGLRIGEVFGLKIASFNPLTDRLDVDMAWSHAREVTPKSTSGRRSLKIGGDVKTAVEAAISRAQGMENPLGLMFPGAGGGHRDPGHWRESVFHPTSPKSATS